MLLLSGFLICAAHPKTLQAQYQPAEVLVVEVGGLSIYQDRKRYVLSAPRGDTQVRVYCRFGSVDVSCRDDARNLLKQHAAQKGSNLAVIVKESILESNPPQYELSAVFYRMQPLP